MDSWNSLEQLTLLHQESMSKLYLKEYHARTHVNHRAPLCVTRRCSYVRAVIRIPSRCLEYTLNTQHSATRDAQGTCGESIRRNNEMVKDFQL